MTTEPKLLTEADIDRFGTMSRDAVTAELRARGLIAEKPVDPLRVMADKFAVSQGCCDGGPFSNEVFALLEQAKAIGMELAPRKELTREMVWEALRARLYVVVSWDEAETIAADLTEALQ